MSLRDWALENPLRVQTIIVGLFCVIASLTIGSAAQIVLYSLAVVGAHQMIQRDCMQGGQCHTHNAAAVAVASMFAGVHMIAMLLMVIPPSFYRQTEWNQPSMGAVVYSSPSDERSGFE
jgi:hypothetical protein